MLEQLQTAVSGLQATLASAMHDSTGKLGASVQMMQSVNNLMEEFLVRSLELGVLVAPERLLISVW